MAFLKGVFALLLALVAAVTFTQDPRPQGAYAGTGCAGDQPYPQVTKEMKGTKYDCTMTIYNDPTTDPPTPCGDSYEEVTDMYLFLRCSKGNDYWAFAKKVEGNCYTDFPEEQAAIEEFARDIVLPGIYEYWDDNSEPISPSPFCSVWLKELEGGACPEFKIPFAMKSVSVFAQDQISTGPTDDPFAWFTDGMYVSVFNLVLAVED